MRAGTLQYTKASLATMFFWLLWGDFCFTLMELVIPSILPLKMQSLNAPNWVLGMIVTTIPSAMNLMINPIVSFRSDRLRSRWGRRIPFLLMATPFVTLFLVLLGCSEPIGRALHDSFVSGMMSVSPSMTIMALIAVFVVCFQFFNMFICSVYYYLFNDVMPDEYLGRGIALFRVVGAAAGSAFNFFIFPYGRTHMTTIFIGAGLLYCAGFIAMCLKIKEGEYPAPPQNIGGKMGLLAAARTYSQECFSHPFYWRFFLMNAFFQLTTCMTAFSVLYWLSLGLTMKQVGFIQGMVSLVMVILYYPAGMLSDRFHPMRVMVGAMIGSVLLTPIGFIYLFHDFAPNKVFIILCVQNCVMLPMRVLYVAAALPAYMRILPKERYGQFGSADAMVRSTMIIFGGLAAGIFMDLMKKVCGGDQFYYRFIPFWNISCQLIGLWFMAYVYRSWKRHGGARNYLPPKTWGNA
jgi:MFS family permease